MKSRTKDELFILTAYEESLQKGDLSISLNFYDIGRRSGITEKGVNAICNLLIRSNFIKKINKDEFQLTKHGESLAQRLLEE